MFDNGKKVSLGGRRGKEVKSRAEILQEAKAKRQQRSAITAPAKAATKLQQHARGLLTRLRLSITVLQHAAELAIASVESESHSTSNLMHAAVRQLGLLWANGSCSHQWPPAKATRLVGAFSGVALRDTAWRVSTPSDIGWVRRHARLLPALLDASTHGSGDAAALACELCLPRSPAARELLTGAAAPILTVFSRMLHADADAIPSAHSASRVASLARALLEDAVTGQPAPPPVVALVLYHVPPVTFLVRPPTTERRAALKTLFGGLSAPTRRALEESLATTIARPGGLLSATLGEGVKIHEAAGVCVDALLACVDGVGADWRRGGWEEGKPRLLKHDELAALMASQVQRTLLSLTAASASTSAATPASVVGSVGGRETSGMGAPTEGVALLSLMRAHWDVAKAVQIGLGRVQMGRVPATTNPEPPMPPTAPLSETPMPLREDEVSEVGERDLSEVGERDVSMGDAIEELLNMPPASPLSSTAVEVAGAPPFASGATVAPPPPADRGVPPAPAATAGAMNVVEASIADNLSPGVCGICYDEPEPPATLRRLRCTHGFCDGCWGGLLTAALERGPACIHDACPMPGCDELISGGVWYATATLEGRRQLQQFALRSFVDQNTLLALCPSASCGMAAAHAQPRAPPELMGCACGASFCVLCGEPPHWPLACHRRTSWTALLHQSPDALAIMQLSRPCPTCHVRTQRSQGCMHIVCTQCGAEWCWQCGQTGKRGQVHHVHECNRAPDPNWVYEAEERKILDGRLLEVVDGWAFRREQIELVAKHAPVASAAEHARQMLEQRQHEGASSSSSGSGGAAGSSGGQPRDPITPTSLRGTLLRALGVLRWFAVYDYYARSTHDALPPRCRYARHQLAVCTDTLFDACNFGGAPRWEVLASDEAGARRVWLVTCLQYLMTHMPAGPA